MKVLVIGEGTVEHALVWQLSQSRHIDKIYCCPGNRGIAETAECIDVSPLDFRTLIDFVKYEWIDLTIVCSRELFLKGIVTAFQNDGCRILGPEKAAAQCMTSRVMLKNLMRQHRIPTPEYKVFTSYLHAQEYIRLKAPPFIIKTDGALDNKSIFTAFTIDDAINALKMIMEDRIFGDAGKHVVIEENLQGKKVSFVSVTDGQTMTPLTDLYKYVDIRKGKKGLIATVMGAYSPTGIITDELKDEVMTQIMEPLLIALKSEGIYYKGLLFADLICTQKGPYLFELQCCFPDPETQTLLPRLRNDFVDLAFSVIEERLSDITIEWRQKASICIAVSSTGRDQKGQNGLFTDKLDKIKSMKDIAVFLDSTSKTVLEIEKIMSITATGSDIKAAKETARRAIDAIHFDGIYYEKDIINT